MGADDDPLDPVIQSILDGRPVDWTSAETQLPPCDRPLLEPLRIVATIAGQHPIQTVNTLGDESLDDRFALQELIGHGASGDVYRVWDTRLRREVAVKALRRDRPFAASVIAEARRIARVRHPGVVTIHDVYESATSAVICMELLRGRTLESLLTERGAFSVAEAAEIGRQLCQGLAAIHRAGVVHGDVKAHNVMLEPDGRVVLMDFGAGVDQEEQHASAREGTPLYLAPEVLAGDPARPASDIYSVGVLLYHLATGAYPVSGRTLVEIRAAHALNEAAGLATRHVSSPLSEPVARALRRDPAERFASADAMATALSRQRSTKRATLMVIGTVLVAVAIGLWSVRPGSVPVRTGVNVRQLAISQDFDGIGGLSEDGSLITYTSKDGTLKLMNTHTGNTRVLVAADFAGWSSAPSRFRPRRGTVVFARDDRSCGCMELREVPAGGGASRVLFRDPRLTGLTPRGITRDGSRMLVIASQPNETDQLALIDIDSAQYRSILPVPRNMQTADLSPDGRFIAYDHPASRSDLSGDISVADTMSGIVHALVTGAGDDAMPTWSPEGEALLFASDRAGTRGLWRVPVANGRAVEAPRVLQRDMGLFLPVHLSARGALLYFRSPVVDVEVVAFDPEGGALGSPRVASGRFAGSNSVPVWAPDGRSIAYVSERKVMGPARSTIVIRDLSSGVERDIQVPINGPLDPAGSPDGRTLAVRGPGTFDGVTGVRLIDIQTSAVTTVIPVNGVDSLQWAPDGRTVYFLSGGGIRRVDVRTRQQTLISIAGGWTPRRIAVSPSGESIAATALRGDEAGVVVLPASGGTARPLLVRSEKDSDIPIVWTWTLDGRRLLAVRPAEKGPDYGELVTISAADGRVSPAGLIREGLSWVRMRPDGREIAYRAGLPKRTLWIIDGFLQPPLHH